jgi:hypothetical protein
MSYKWTCTYGQVESQKRYTPREAFDCVCLPSWSLIAERFAEQDGEPEFDIYVKDLPGFRYSYVYFRRYRRNSSGHTLNEQT